MKGSKTGLYTLSQKDKFMLLGDLSIRQVLQQLVLQNV